jgi:hypothetical protein
MVARLEVEVEWQCCAAALMSASSPRPRRRGFSGMAGRSDRQRVAVVNRGRWRWTGERRRAVVPLLGVANSFRRWSRLPACSAPGALVRHSCTTASRSRHVVQGYGFPKLGASASRNVSRNNVSNTCSAKYSRASAATCRERFQPRVIHGYGAHLPTRVTRSGCAVRGARCSEL